jgi:hypothetical protein
LSEFAQIRISREMRLSREIAQLFWPRPSGVKKAASSKATLLECNAATRSERNPSAHDFFTLTFARARSYQCEEGVMATTAASTKTSAAENKQ